MSGLETATQAGLYWAVAFAIAVLLAVIAWLGLRRERRTGRHEHKRLARELGSLHVRLGSQQHELERSHAECADRVRQLEQQGRVLADVQRELDAKGAALARANDHHAQLLANLSHEMRTPLNSALILSKLLADNGPANLSPEQVKFARTIYNAGNDLLELLNDILDLAKIEARQLDIRYEPLELGALLAALEAAVGPIAEHKRLDLAIRLAPDLPQTLDSDAQRLPQVLKNLLATAIKISDRGTVSLDVDFDGSNIDFAVRTATLVSRRPEGGTGLGLALARELAPLLGGRIEVESEPGQASMFRFIVPAETRMMEPAPARAGAGGSR